MPAWTVADQGSIHAFAACAAAAIKFHELQLKLPLSSRMLMSAAVPRVWALHAADPAVELFSSGVRYADVIVGGWLSKNETIASSPCLSSGLMIAQSLNGDLRFAKEYEEDGWRS